ncbi:hypothetical protein BCF55_0596 [Hydrogenivirga caldilitoris]|uniref:Cytochrome c domain-containing protein n=1 Tax=Hydrogenivirga caldilitoris TaxID=246264 RepID=A0A497XN88_9AQUI|nr:porin family protein [Hydrogenivirga caldilitoris]RLJ70328.1 hypothetical protein BCF55_0596 [Hydrogenivirga caldilitoris]
MKGKILTLAALTGAVLPFAVNEYFNSRCPELPKEVILPSEAKAMPSFARQTGLSCSTCHTIPPRLNAYGRTFKIRGYTDGKAIEDILTGEGESILKYNPVSIRVLSYPYSKKKGEDREVIFPDEVVIAFAGRISENVGTFAAFASEEGEPFEPEIVKVALVKDFGNNTVVGIVGGKTSPTGTDPFDSLNLYSRITRFRTTVWEGVRKKDASDLWDNHNYGASLYASVSNWVYASVGAYTGIVRDDGTLNKDKSDPFDFYGRVAVTPQGIPADLNIGLFTYIGKDEDPITDQTLVKPRRYGVDAGVIYNIGDIGIELNGIYVNGKDKFPSNPDFKHNGYNLSATLYWKYRLGLSLLYGNYKYKSDNPLTTDNEDGVKRADTTVHVSYLIRPNVRLGAEYTTTNFSGVNAPEDTHLTSLILDFAF